jgi:3-methyl-2-oxobutanoate hydroxymethyltransferase
LPVTVEDIVYHTACVARGNKTSLLAADMPFGSYGTPESAYKML